MLPCHLQVHPAPGPEEVNWQSLWFNHSQRVLRGWLTAPFAIIVVLLPVSGLTSAISMLNSEVCGYSCACTCYVGVCEGPVRRQAAVSCCDSRAVSASTPMRVYLDDV
jgi:hypothetical protein